MKVEVPTVSTSDEKLPLGGISPVNKWLSPNDLHADQIFDEVIGEMLNPRLNSPLSKTAKKIVRQVKLDGYRDYRPQSRTLVMNLPEVIYYDDGYRDNFSRRLRDAIRELGYGNYFKSFDYHPHRSRKAKVTDEQTFEFQSHTLAEVEAEEIEYLVKGYIPLGMLTYLFAPKGTGKTKVCDWLTANCTRKQRTVIRFNLEDAEREIIKPNLYAAGAVLDRVTIPDGVKDKEGELQHPDFSNADHLHALSRMIQSTDASLVIIEPINNYRGRGKTNSEDDMRPIYMGLAAVARDTGAAILGVGHTNKKQDVDVLDKAMGDGSHTRVARVNFFLNRNPMNPKERILTNAGSNIHVGPALVFEIVPKAAFKLDSKTINNVAVAKMRRTDEISGEELLEQSRTIRGSQSEAIAEFLIESFAGRGKVLTSKIQREAQKHNSQWKWETIKQVFRRRKLGTTDAEGFGEAKQFTWEIGATTVALPRKK